MFQEILTFFKRNKRNIFMFLAISTLFFLDFDLSFAETTDEAKKQLNQTISIFNAFIKVIAGLMAIMTAFVSLFLQPDWVNGTFISLDTYMREIWILVANTVYFIFAFILVFIAFANIIGKGGDKFGLKQALPRFIVGILIVPFSWFVVQFMISAAGILTVGALSLPYDTFKENTNFPVFSLSVEGENTPLAEATVCTKWVIHFGDGPHTIPGSENGAAGPDQAISQLGSEEGLKDNIYCKPDGKIRIIDILSGTAGDDGESIYNIIALYTFGLIGLETFDNLEGEHFAAGVITGIVSLITKIGLSLIFLIVYFILLLALFFALFIRILRIWIYIMLSPLYGLMYFFGKTSGEGALSKFNLKEFFALTMTPVYVALALSFGFMFMLVAGNGIKQQYNVNDDDTVVPIEVGIVSVELTGTVNSTGEESISGEGVPIGELLRPFRGAGGALGEIIVMLFGIGMLWIAVMAALRQSEITKAAVEPIAQFGNQVGKLAAQAPMYAPIIPTGKGMTSAVGIGEVKRKAFAAVNNYKVDQGDKLGNQLGIPGSEASSITSESRKAMGVLEQKNGTIDKDYISAVEKATFTGTKTANLANNDEYIRLLERAMKDMKIEGIDVSSGDRTALTKAVAEIDAKLEEIQPNTGGILSRISRELKGTNFKTTDLDNALAGKQNASGSSQVSQATNHEVTKIVSGLGLTEVKRINNFQVTGNQDTDIKKLRNENKDLDSVMNNLSQLSEDKMVTKDELRNILQKEGITKKEIIDIVMKDLDGSIVFKGESNDSGGDSDD